MQVAVLGTGIMGAGMARSMLRAGHAVTVWNRTAVRAQPLAEDGVTVAGAPAEAVDGAEVVLVMVFDTAAVLDVVAAAARKASDAVWLQASTIGRDGTDRVAELAGARGLKLVDAPVLGTKGPAEAGTLVSLLSGDPAHVAAARPAVDGYSARVVDAGPELGAASALKLVCNAWISTVNAAVGQSVALAEGLGLDPALFVEAISGGAADNQYLHVKSDMIASGEFPPSFTLDGAVKDVELILAAARRASVGDRVLAALAQTYRRAAESGHGEQDMSAVYFAFGA
jgi:3-hydroxyisobutyrate dehydrogenase